MNITEERMAVLKKHFINDLDTTSPDILYQFGNPSNALLYSTLFAPDLQEVDNSVLIFWKVFDSDSRQAFLEARKRVKSESELEELESNFNWFEVGYIFSDNKFRDEEDMLLAGIIAKCWKGYLSCQYPKRTFVVEVLSPEQTGSTVGVHFYEKR